MCPGMVLTGHLQGHDSKEGHQSPQPWCLPQRRTRNIQLSQETTRAELLLSRLGHLVTLPCFWEDSFCYFPETAGPRFPGTLGTLLSLASQSV